MEIDIYSIDLIEHILCMNIHLTIQAQVSLLFNDLFHLFNIKILFENTTATKYLNKWNVTIFIVLWTIPSQPNMIP